MELCGQDRERLRERSMLEGGLATLAAGVAAIVCGASAEAVFGRNRAGRRQQARRLAFYLAHVGLGVSLTRAGAMFGRHRAAARRACARIEEARERPQWDVALDRLERAMRIWRATFCAHAEGGR